MGSQSLEQYCSIQSSIGPRAIRNHARVLLGAKPRSRSSNQTYAMSWSRVGAGNLGVSESSRPDQIELAEISLRGCLVDACAPCIGTPRYHTCQAVKVLAKSNESTLVSEFFASSACPTRGYRCSWMARSRRRVSRSSRNCRVGTDV
jgi:hypothetical protein